MDIPSEQGHEQKDIEIVDAHEKLFMLDEIKPYVIELETQTTRGEGHKSC